MWHPREVKEIYEWFQACNVIGRCRMHHVAIAPKATAQAPGQVPLTQERPALPQAQISLDVGMAPDCPYGYYGLRRMPALPTATTARNGSPAVRSLARVRGFMALATSTAR